MFDAPIFYSICFFLILSLLSSILFVERIKQTERKHMVAGVYVALAVFVHAAVLVMHAIFKNK